MMLSDPDFLLAIKALPLISFDLIVKNRNGQVLLGFRKNRPAKDCWFVPGGRIFKNEPVKNAFERIGLTELGIHLSFSDAAFIGVFDHIYEDNAFNVENVNTHYVVLAYMVMLHEEKRITIDEQHSVMKWWDVEALCKAPDVHGNTKLYFQQ